MEKLSYDDGRFSSNLTLKDENSQGKCLNGNLSAIDLAPVHSPTMKSHNAKVVKMEVVEGKTTTKDASPINKTLTSCMKSKLSLSEKNDSKAKNGIKIGTTDVEVHFGPPINSDKKLKDGKSNHHRPVSLDKHKATCLPKTSNISKTKPSFVSSQEVKVVQSISSKPVNNIININSVVHKSDAISNSNGTICNGYTSSEVTSSTNSLAISEFSISSDKSIDSSFSYSGVRPRSKDYSSSSSQSILPSSSDYEGGNSLCLNLSSISDSCNSRIEENKIDSMQLPKEIEVKEEMQVEYKNYKDENQMEAIMRLIQNDLSEPYSIYTYRYFIHNWPELCFLAMHKGEVVGAIVCKLDVHKKTTVRGYIAMLAVDQNCRKRRIGSNLVQRAIREMSEDDADEVVLETEITNKPALQLYENLGFVRDKRLFRYYLNGVDALRLKLWLR